MELYTIIAMKIRHKFYKQIIKTKSKQQELSKHN